MSGPLRALLDLAHTILCYVQVTQVTRCFKHIPQEGDVCQAEVASCDTPSVSQSELPAACMAKAKGRHKGVESGGYRRYGGSGLQLIAMDTP